AWLRAARDAIDPAVRRQSARSLAGRAIDPVLLVFFAEDAPAIAAPLLGGARLGTEAWLAVLPRLGPAARSLLRNREDLPPEVKTALGALGPSDFRLESAVAEAVAPAGGDSQIRELVDRIEAYRHRRDASLQAPAPAENDVQGFRWETGTDGVFV